MKRYSFDHISTSKRSAPFWKPWGFWKWLLYVVTFAVCLLLFLLLFCIPIKTVVPVILHDGDVEITLTWFTADDLDLHCIGPDGEEIYYDYKQSSSGGTLDKDMNAGSGRHGHKAVEHIYWPHHGAPHGKYKINVELYCKRNLYQSEFTVRFKSEGCSAPIDTTIRKTIVRENDVIEIGTFRVE